MRMGAGDDSGGSMFDCVPEYVFKVANFIPTKSQPSQIVAFHVDFDMADCVG